MKKHIERKSNRVGDSKPIVINDVDTNTESILSDLADIIIDSYLEEKKKC